MSAVPIRSNYPAVPTDLEVLRAWHPGAPRGKDRPRVDTRGERPRFYSSRETVQAEKAIRETLGRRWRGAPLEEGLLVVELLFSLPAVTRGPADIDNLAKLVLDSANGVVWVDDRQVVGLYVRRVVAPQEASVGTLIIVGRDG